MSTDLPKDLKYTEDHEWVKVQDEVLIIGVTNFAQGELGDIVYVDVDTIDQELELGAVFGSVEAVKTVSDLFMPIAGLVLEVNEKLEDEPELVNSDPYGEGWIIKLKPNDMADLDALLTADDYASKIG